VFVDPLAVAPSHTHITEHLAFPCPQCETIWDAWQQLQVHRASARNYWAPASLHAHGNVCPLCYAVFSSARSARRHYRLRACFAKHGHLLHHRPPLPASWIRGPAAPPPERHQRTLRQHHHRDDGSLVHGVASKVEDRRSSTNTSVLKQLAMLDARVRQLEDMLAWLIHPGPAATDTLIETMLAANERFDSLLQNGAAHPHDHRRVALGASFCL